MLNRCEFIGHLGAAPEVRYLDNGLKVASFSLAVTKKGYIDKTGNTVPDKTTWVNIVAWRGLAEISEKFLGKGSHVYVAGELQSRSYEKDGVTRYVTEIVAETIEMLGKKPEAATEYTAPTQSTSVASTPNRDESTDDLPF